jgi:hypothetical protein
MGKPNFIYVGPSLPSLGLKKNTIFRGAEVPPALQPLVEKKPAIRSLFVSTKDLAEVMKRLGQKGSLEHTANQEMLTIAKTTPR